jgi:NAD(P)-dependent dehydrogenase (short-subunit alcohol dehydrogenase family)
MMSSPVLAGQAIVVTGAGSGLGAAYAKAATQAGASVVVNDLSVASATRTATELRETGAPAIPFAADVADWDAAEALIEHCVTEFGKIDGLVNNAGVVGRPGLMLAETPDEATRVMNVNVCGTLFPGVHAARAMVAAGNGGAIVNVTSGDQCGTELVTTYGASKAAVAGLTFGWAMELADHGIRVNAIAPNARTDMVIKAVKQLGHNPQERNYPSTSDNAAVIVFLLSDAAARLNGQIVRVDHGHVSVMAHPLVVEPRVSIDWTVEALTQIFSEDLRESLQPLGLVTARVEHLGPLRP